MNVPWYRRLFIVILTTLFSLTIVTAAFAIQPEFFDFSIDETGKVGNCKGFSVMEHIEGSVTVSILYDQDGIYQMRISRVSVLSTFTNSKTGASISSQEVGIAMGSLDKEGSHYVAVMGISTHLEVQGEGLVFAQNGRVVYDSATFEAVFEAGRHDYDDNFMPALCSALD